jgi:hypothetical protein
MSHKKIPERPDDNLSPVELQKAWDKLLDKTVGGLQTGSSAEVVQWVSPEYLEVLAASHNRGNAPLTAKMQRLVDAFWKVIKKLDPVQAEVVQRFYGIEYPAQTEEEIASAVVTKSGIFVSRRMISYYLTWAKKNLKRLIEKELGGKVE